MYVLDGGRLHSITRVLDDDQRAALRWETLVGAWRHSINVFRYRADGSYTIERSGQAWDSGDATVEGGVLRIVSNERTQACQPGHVGLWWLPFTDADRHAITKIEDMCAPRGGPSARLWRITE